MFRKGDKVYDVVLGQFGVVTGINKGDLYPVEVMFREMVIHYTDDGFFNGYDKMRRLYFNKFDVVVPKEALERKRWRAKDDECYFFVTPYGEIVITTECGAEEDDLLYAVGNYFKERDDAKKSTIYNGFKGANE